MKTIYLGIDQSLSNTGVCLSLDNEIILSTSIPCTPDFMKFYKDNSICDFKKTLAYKLNLVDDTMKRTKKIKDYTKEEKEILKVSKQKRIFYITKTIDNIIKQYKSEYKIKVGLESISFGSSGMVITLAQLLGSLECIIAFNDLQHILFTPSQIKKFGHGKGNADKDLMIGAVPEKELNILKETCSKNTKGLYVGLDDRVDAFHICRLLQHTLES